MIALKTILVATDLSQPSEAAWERARTLAAAFDASLHVIHIVSAPLDEPWTGYIPASALAESLQRLATDAQQQLERLAAIARAEGIQVMTATLCGDPADEILEYARTHAVDLIVCGTHGRHGWDRFVMGSVAERIVRLATCPVLTVRTGADVAAAA